jgi:hypothetical protein
MVGTTTSPATTSVTDGKIRGWSDTRRLEMVCIKLKGGMPLCSKIPTVFDTPQPGNPAYISQCVEECPDERYVPKTVQLVEKVVVGPVGSLKQY